MLSSPTSAARPYADLLWLRRALNETEERSSLRPALTRLVQAGLEPVQSCLELLDEAASEGLLYAPRALVAISEVLVLYAGAAARPCGSGAAAPQAGLSAARLAESVAALAAQRAACLAVADMQRGQALAPVVADKLVAQAEAYVGFAMACVGACVSTARVDELAAEPPPPGVWACALAPARVDLAGGWTDTPPICYEVGGRVVNLAVTVDGELPIGARARRLADELVVRISHRDGADEPTVTVRALAELADHSNPLAPGALVKAVLISLGVVDLHSADELPAQLAASGGGLEVQLWSRLPQGSGLGTSSILAATVVAAVGATRGRAYDVVGLTHAVLQADQQASTGGGWQDQLGAIVGGAKLCTCEAGLPLEVGCRRVPLSRAALRTLHAHLGLIYTGQTRLAKNLLQDVLRRWLLGRPASVANIRGLVDNADEMARALEAADMAAVGRALGTCVGRAPRTLESCVLPPPLPAAARWLTPGGRPLCARYWEQKKLMCEAEPPKVTRILAKLRDAELIHGASLTGAGGGGFLLVVTRQPDAGAELRRALADEEGVTFHGISVYEDDLAVRLEGGEGGEGGDARAGRNGAAPRDPGREVWPEPLAPTPGAAAGGQLGAAAEAEGAPRRRTVLVPDGAREGDRLFVSLPNGKQLSFAVPPGAEPGDELNVNF